VHIDAILRDLQFTHRWIAGRQAKETDRLRSEQIEQAIAASMPSKRRALEQRFYWMLDASQRRAQQVHALQFQSEKNRISARYRALLREREALAAQPTQLLDIISTAVAEDLLEETEKRQTVYALSRFYEQEGEESFDDMVIRAVIDYVDRCKHLPAHMAVSSFMRSTLFLRGHAECYHTASGNIALEGRVELPDSTIILLDK
jgi:hypothetical protein